MTKKALIISGIAWNATYQRHQLNSKILASLGYSVDFIESCKTSKLSLKIIYLKIKNYLLKKDSNSNSNSNDIPNSIKIIRSTLIPPSGFLGKLINYVLFKATLQKKLKSHYDVIIVYVPTDHLFYIKESMYNILVYDCVRAFSIWGGYSKSLISNEKNIILGSNKVLCDSFYIKDKYLPSIKPDIKPIQLLPPIELISKPNTPNLKKTIKNIGYFGSISSHIDIDIFNLLINEGYNIFFWGIDDDKLMPDGTINLGYISNQEELFNEIVNNCDALIIPYNKPLDGVYPAKLALSLLTNLPIYCSFFYDANIMRDKIYVYNDKQELLKSLKKFNLDEHYRKLALINTFLNELSLKNYTNKLEIILNNEK